MATLIVCGIDMVQFNEDVSQPPELNNLTFEFETPHIQALYSIFLGSTRALTLTEIMNFGRYAVYAGYAGYAVYAAYVGYAWKMSVQIKRGILTLTKIVLKVHIELLSSSSLGTRWPSTTYQQS